ncbi:chaperonin 10-like protein [Apodospora peruviana]|uniref:Chaperonin 10-like protein n=1 Tax=Apodospora peruviana TaxID=516989 RepID=A0AAE0IR82_9PEZI|nr:chaperonin 10-like protein [Apodospora peruviana]
MPEKMKVQCLEAFNTPYVLRTVDSPAAFTGCDLIIKVEAASYCHTDAVLAAGQMPPNPPEFPHIGCHEFAGQIISMPTYGLDSHFRPGDRVGVPGRSFHPCTKCYECMKGPSDETPDEDSLGYSPYCPHGKNLGISAPGGFREYAIVDHRQVVKIPDGMSSVETAPLMCAGLTIFQALRRACRDLKLPPQDVRVGIIGCGGGLGHLGLQFAAHMGFLKVVGVDNADAPLRLARQTIKKHELDPQVVRVVDARIDNAEMIKKELGAEFNDIESGDRGLDAVIILPENQKAFDYGMAMLRNHSICVVVAFPDKFQISPRDLIFRDITIVGSLTGTRKVLYEMLQFAARSNIRASIKTFPLEKLNELVEEYHKAEGGKLVIDMSLPAE